MQNVEKELPILINQLLQAPADKQRQLIEAYYTPNCRLTHALVIAENREEIIRVFQYWRFITAHLSAKIHDIVLDASGSKVVVFFTQKVEHMGHNPLLTFDLSMSVLLYLETSPKGTKLISKQIDYHSFESIFYHTPLLGNFLEHGVRKYLSWQIIKPTAFVARFWPGVERIVRENVPGVDKNWDRVVQVIKKVWWREESKFKGHELAPYDPAL